MDTLLYNGDHATDGRGLPVAIYGAQELIQRALIRLSVRKGTFAHDPSLGSELYKLRRSDSLQNNRTARSYVQEALRSLDGITVEDVACTLREPDGLNIKITLSIQNEHHALEVTVI